MAFSNANDIINERVNIVDVVSRYVKLTKSGGGFKGLCPFHKEKTPSFNVNEERQYYYCFGCHASGNTITFIMNIESLNFVDAVKKLASDYNIPELIENQNTPVDEKKKQLRDEIQRVNKLAARYFHENLMKNKEALDYLNEKRGVSGESLKEFGLGYAGSGDEFISFMREKGVSMEIMEKASLVRAGAGGRVYSFFHDRIIFPILQNRKVTGFGGRIIGGDGPKYLNSADTPLFNKRRQLYGYDIMKRNIRKFPFIIITEGYFDVISLCQAGIKTAVASLGTAVTSDHLIMLARHRSPVVLLLDGDEAGRRAAARVLELVMPEDIDLRVAFIEEKGEDPDSILKQENGREKLVSLVKEALPVFQKELDRIIAEYNSTVNLEIRIKLRRRIKDLLSRVPSVKYYHYAEYVVKHT
ncbi:MAG: DNA primase, partial [bacterium]